MPTRLRAWSLSSPRWKPRPPTLTLKPLKPLATTWRALVSSKTRYNVFAPSQKVLAMKHATWRRSLVALSLALVMSGCSTMRSEVVDLPEKRPIPPAHLLIPIPPLQELGPQSTSGGSSSTSSNTTPPLPGVTLS